MSPQTQIEKTPTWFRNLLLNCLITLIGYVGLEYGKSRLFEQPARNGASYVVTLSPDQVERFLDSLNTFALSQRELASNMRGLRLDFARAQIQREEFASSNLNESQREHEQRELHKMR